jgi:hypothetical protein
MFFFLIMRETCATFINIVIICYVEEQKLFDVCKKITNDSKSKIYTLKSLIETAHLKI